MTAEGGTIATTRHGRSRRRRTGAGAPRSTSSSWRRRRSPSASRGSTATTSTGSSRGPPSAAGARCCATRRDGATHELTPAPFHVRNRVHEYGGGSYTVDRGRVVASSTDGRAAVAARPGRCRRSRRADARPAACRVRRHARSIPRATACTPCARRTTRPSPPAPTSWSTSWSRSRSTGRTAPAACSSPDRTSSRRRGRRRTARTLAWLEWDLPDMPWDATRLRVAAVQADGSLGPARTVAGGPGISVVQPAWSADGVLHDVSDESGWWNLYAFDGAGRPRRAGAEPRADGGRARRPRLGLRLSLVRVPRRRRDPRGRAAPTGATRSCGSSPTATVYAGSTQPRSPRSRACWWVAGRRGR